MPEVSSFWSPTVSSTYDSGERKTTTTSRPYTGRSRPRTTATSTGYGDNEIICAITESRGISPTIGLSFVNLTTSEAVLCQFADTQTYARTCHKIKVFNPTEIIYMSTAADSKLLSILHENLEVEKYGIEMTQIDRRYWSESTGFEYVQYLAFPDDLESLKVSVGGNYFATCCFAAAMKYTDLSLDVTFASQTLRIRFEPSEGSMMIDLSTISSLELIQNLQNAKSKHSLLGLLSETLTKMGSRILRSNVLQPSTDAAKLTERYEAVGELVTREDMFFAIRTALADFVDTDRCLSNIVILPTKVNFQYMEQSVNNVLMLKTFVDSIKPVWQALTGAASEELQKVRELCNPDNYAEVEGLINYALNNDVTYASKSTELRNQRVYAIKAGFNGFLDVARQTYKEINDDVFQMVNELSDQHDVKFDLKFDPARQYFLRVPASEIEEKPIPDVLINRFRVKNAIECQTLQLMKMNQKIKDAHNEVVSLSDKSVQELIGAVRSKIHPLFKISESLALLDMLSGMAQLVTTQDYVKPDITDSTLALKASRHPILDKIIPSHSTTTRLIPNDVYSTPQHRFQIITGANMSGKSTYIRSIALNALLAQSGCFVPAQHASFPIFHQLFALLATDSNVEANVSSFASEMSSVAFILRNIEPRSLVIVDELGRGTSTTDGLAIAIAIAEALIESKAFVWFVTHFHELPRILAERAGVVNLHLNVDITPSPRDPRRQMTQSGHSDAGDGSTRSATATKMKMTYRIASGPLPTSAQYYGLTLARTISLPSDLTDVAEQVSRALHERNEAAKANPRGMAVARRRKLVLGLKEQVKQARESGMEGKQGLKRWLAKLQEEFIVRLEVIAGEANAAVGFEDEMVEGNEGIEGEEASVSGVREGAYIAGAADADRDHLMEEPLQATPPEHIPPPSAQRSPPLVQHDPVKRELRKPATPQQQLTIKQEHQHPYSTRQQYRHSSSSKLFIPHVPALGSQAMKAGSTTTCSRPVSAAGTDNGSIMSGAEDLWATAHADNEQQYREEVSRKKAGR